MRNAFRIADKTAPALVVWGIAAAGALLVAHPAGARPHASQPGDAQAAPAPPGPNGAAAALKPLTATEQPRCVDLARQAFRDLLGQDRHAVLRMVPVYRESGGVHPRTCRVELFDYVKNLDLQATIDLDTGSLISSRRLEDVRPSVGAAEVLEARRIAETGTTAGAAQPGRPQPAAQKSLAEVLRLPGLEVNGLVRRDPGACARHRCIELSYEQLGPDAGFVDSGPDGPRAPWQPIDRRARVIVDLTSGVTVSMEVY
jgi:hypothetical protein